MYAYVHVCAVYALCMHTSSEYVCDSVDICVIKFADLIMVQQSGNRSAKSVLWVAHVGLHRRMRYNTKKEKKMIIRMREGEFSVFTSVKD